jgi:hypothetical protein
MTTEDEAAAPVEEGTTVEEMLLSSGIVEETQDGTDLELTDEFETEWHELNKQMRGSDRGLRWFATARDVERERVETITGEELFALEIEGETVGEWPSEASFLAETVVRSLLPEWTPEKEWEQLSEDMHREVSTRLLLFLKRCPQCDGEVVFSEEIDDDVIHLSHTCTACDATLFMGTQE